ncbi:basic blue protein-like [Pyrus x bretschneideri]|uniref:basic blue protein-like n=1 Tax=Pyrus x bretschneideri TaxID=225117 RepID=UPI0020305E58|nr:basic blue protein-like [Pyrus x bretschneideri]
MAVGMHKILVIGIGIFVSCLLLQCGQVDAKEYIVGDEKRWSPDANLTQWTEGKKFKAGDVLVFKYNRDPFLMVAAVRDKYLFEKCDLYAGAINIYRSGNDYVVLEKGTTYFAPYLTPYCENGMKLTIDVE